MRKGIRVPGGGVKREKIKCKLERESDRKEGEEDSWHVAVESRKSL